MKFRKLILLTAALTLAGGSAIYADSVTQKVKIMLNKQQLDDDGALMDGKAYVGVRFLGDVVQGMVSWDDSEKKVTIYKPNVHMFLLSGSKPFGSVPKQKSTSFQVFAQIDNLQTSISGFKVTIADPYGDETWIDGRTSQDSDFPTDKDNFWFTSAETTYEFKYSGKYTIRFWMKPADNSPMQVVSEKTIIAK